MGGMTEPHLTGLRQRPLRICYECGDSRGIEYCTSCASPVCVDHRDAEGQCVECVHNVASSVFPEDARPSRIVRVVNYIPAWVWFTLALILGMLIEKLFRHGK